MNVRFSGSESPFTGQWLGTALLAVALSSTVGRAQQRSSPSASESAVPMSAVALVVLCDPSDRYAPLAAKIAAAEDTEVVGSLLGQRRGSPSLGIHHRFDHRACRGALAPSR